MTAYKIGDRVWITAASFLRFKAEYKDAPGLVEMLKKAIGHVATVVEPVADQAYSPDYIQIAYGRVVLPRRIALAPDWIEPAPDNMDWLDGECERQAAHYGMTREQKARWFAGAAAYDEQNPHL